MSLFFCVVGGLVVINVFLWVRTRFYGVICIYVMFFGLRMYFVRLFVYMLRGITYVL